MKKKDLDIYHKKKDTDIKDNTYYYEINSKKDDSIQSQKLNYINILDELSQLSSSSKSNFSMKNINLYSKKTHKTKFCSNESVKKSSSNKKNIKNENNKKILNNKNKKRK